MKIKCDFCSQEEASVFCTADEAPLCVKCDRDIHHANKLAEKHTRFSLIHPSVKELPRCDICQDKRAFLFCREDRAILCRECDVSIHKANEHTRKHSRFLLTGVRLSASASEYPISTPSSPSSGRKAAVSGETKLSKASGERPNSVSANISNPREKTTPAAAAADKTDYGSHLSDTSSISASRISEYLETLPGWRVDDFLDPSSGFSEFPEDGCGTNFNSFSSGDFGVWVPQDTSQFPYLPFYIPQNELKLAEEANAVKVSRKRIDDGFRVPEIRPQPVKKSRNFW